MRIGIGALGVACSYQPQITQAATAAGIPPSLALAVASWESNCNPNATNVNPGSASVPSTTDYGLFQINTQNLNTLGIASNPLDPTANINAGVSLLAQLYNQYGGDITKTLEAYNAGPGTVASGKVPPSTVTQYVPGVTALQSQWDSVLGTTPDSLAPASADTSADTTDNSGTTDYTPYYLAGGLALVAFLLLS